MKRLFLAVVLVVMCLLFSTVSKASLWDRGGGLIYDNVLDITWLQNAKYDGARYWDEAMTWAEQLEYYDPLRDMTWSDWRLPSAHNMDGSYPISGYNVTTSEMGHLYYVDLQNQAGGPCQAGPFINLTGGRYWSSSEYGPPLDNNAFYFDFSTGEQGSVGKDVNYQVWAVMDGDVPIPSTLLLLSSSLIGFLGFRRQFGKK